MKVVDHVKWRASIGHGLDWHMLGLLLQELFLALKLANPARVTGLEDVGQLPTSIWIRRFAERHNLVGRATMPISKGRQVVTPEEIKLWQEDAITFFSSKPELMAALQDKRRVWNTDETSVELGVAHKRVLTEKGTKVLYNVTSSTRDHITAVLTVNAAGEMALLRCFFRGVRNVADNHLAGLPKDGKSGTWGFSTTPNGFITGETLPLILQDLVAYVEEHQIPRPIILFMDGAAPHISLAMAEFCKANQIQPWLFKPNCTHITQPLDLTVMKSLKDVLKRKVTEWQQRNTTALSKYTVVPLLRASVEELLVSRPEVIVSGFRRAGLVPWNPSAVEQEKLAPSSIFAPPQEEQQQQQKETQQSQEEKHQQEEEQQQRHIEPEVLESGDIAIYSEPPEALGDDRRDTWMDEEEEVQKTQEAKKVPGMREVQEIEAGGTEGRKEVELPNFSKRQLSTFEAVFFTEEQVKKCEEIFNAHLKSSSPIYLAWKALKVASLPTEEEVVEEVLASHSPKNIVKRKARCGRKVPDGPGRFDPTSEEWKAILDRPAAPEPKKKKPEPKKKKPAAKENKKKKTAVNQIKSMLIQ